jgi:hypothetical protein
VRLIAEDAIYRALQSRHKCYGRVTPQSKWHERIYVFAMAVAERA